VSDSSLFMREITVAALSRDLTGITDLFVKTLYVV